MGLVLGEEILALETTAAEAKNDAFHMIFYLPPRPVPHATEDHPHRRPISL